MATAVLYYSSSSPRSSSIANGITLTDNLFERNRDLYSLGHRKSQETNLNGYYRPEYA
jgi:hypothetical protein